MASLQQTQRKRMGSVPRLPVDVVAAIAAETEKFEWTEKCENSFQELKQRLVMAPMLALPDGKGDFVKCSDASHKGLGCVLMQHSKGIQEERLKDNLRGFIRKKDEVVERKMLGSAVVQRTKDMIDLIRGRLVVAQDGHDTKGQRG
ncbi:hypothetical protein AgCh_038293 [Apium graveolens]